MVKWLKQLDDILRGDATRISALREGRIDTPTSGLSVVVIALAVIYGLCMGGYAVIRTAWADTGVTGDALMQLVASAVKLPLLFFLTLVVTFPSLYVFNALVGSRLSMRSVARLLVAMLGVMLAVLVSLGPIVVFFAVCTNSYPFMKLLNVVMATIAGVLGLAFLLRTLHRLVMVQDQIDFPSLDMTENSSDDADDDLNSALDPIESSTGRKATAVFKIWVVVFALVGAQMSWVLRPFIGSPDKAFTWFRQREDNFFHDVIRSIGELFGAQPFMHGLLTQADEVLRARPWLVRQGVHRRRLLIVTTLMIVFGVVYGAAMGSYGGARALQMLYSAIKVPLLLTATFALSLPSFFVFNTLLGLRRDFAEAVRALIATQAGLTIILASFAPFTVLWYASIADYDAAKMFNLLMFAIASVTAQRLLRRFYRPLIERDRRHLLLMRCWLVIYAFIGVQMGWVLRPFIGKLGTPTTFFRESAWSNAYVEVAQTLWRLLNG